MSKIIELCGAPGVGKSTIYKSLASGWGKNNDWIPAEYLYPYGKSDYSFIIDLIKRFFKKDLRKEDVREMRNAGSRFISQHPEYVEACINKILVKEKQSLNGTDQRFEKASYMYDLIKRVQICRESSCGRTVIIEEGLINAIRNALYKSDNITEEKEEIIQLLNIMPLPDGVVYIETDIKENINRLMSRKRIIPSFETLSKDQLSHIIQKFRNTWKAATTLLEEKGIPVLYLNSDELVRTNASKITSFAKNLDSKSSSMLVNNGM